jgi:SPW repeat-containing protein
MNEAKESPMVQVRFDPPVHWEDWCSWLLALWLCISPGVLSFGGEVVATSAAVFTGFLLICTEIVTLSTFRSWEEWANVLLGAWLIAAPWILGVPSAAATINFTVVGVLVAGLALYELRQNEKKL